MRKLFNIKQIFLAPILGLLMALGFTVPASSAYAYNYVDGFVYIDGVPTNGVSISLSCANGDYRTELSFTPPLGHGGWWVFPQGSNPNVKTNQNCRVTGSYCPNIYSRYGGGTGWFWNGSDTLYQYKPFNLYYQGSCG